MTSICVDQRGSFQIEACEKECYKTFLGILAQHLVSEGKDLAYIRMHFDEHAEVSPSRRHEQRRTGTVASHVSNDNSESTVQHRDEIKEVSGCRTERMHCRANIKAVELRHFWQKALLNPSRQARFRFMCFHGRGSTI